MKKILTGIFALALLAMTGMSYAGDVTLVNKYNQPVEFAVSQSALYDPIWIGILGPGDKFSFETEGSITKDFFFIAYPPGENSIVSHCGTPTRPLDKVTVKAGKLMETNEFGCKIFVPCKKQ